MALRDTKGRFTAKKLTKNKCKRSRSTCNDHNYYSEESSSLDSSLTKCRQSDTNVNLPGNVDRDGWRVGRRIVELGVLLDKLEYCVKCKLGPVALTKYSLVGELRKGLSGFLYVRCSNMDCEHVNVVPYGKTHRLKDRGMPCFTANTKLGVAMIDSIGGSGKVNNMLSTLNIAPVNRKSLQDMERRAGRLVESVAKQSIDTAAKNTFQKEMSEISQKESIEAEASMDGLIEDLGVAPLPDASPATKSVLQTAFVSTSNETECPEKASPSPPRQHKRKCKLFDHNTCRKTAIKKNLLSTFKPKSRYGMSCSADTAWQKRGFDSLTSHTFLMSSSKMGKKVLKSVICHRQCSTCNWWRRHRPGQQIRQHRCVRNHFGSARSMESESGEKAVLALAKAGTPVEILEGDGDNTLLARLKSKHNISLKKRYDKNHVIKNLGKSFYGLQNEKGIKISKITISHLQKCVSYALSKNCGDLNGLQENLKAIIPHNFGDHQLCQPRFCGYLRNKDVSYIHRSLPYKSSLTGEMLKQRLDDIMKPFIAKASQLVNLGSSQQCEHANREVSLKAPKNIYYGGSEALDVRVQATAAFINEGRNYIVEVNKQADLSPGHYTQKYAQHCAIKRQKCQETFAKPSTKGRRLFLKKERAVNQSATESLEGATYQSEVGHTADIDIDKIPDPIPRGVFKPVCSSGEPSYITVDLETTDLIRGDVYPHITQIAAKHVGTENSFNCYVLPKLPMSASAERVTKIIVTNSTDMCVDGVPVETKTIQTALRDFLIWLNQFRYVFLIAHNGKRFDFPIVVNACQASGMFNEFSSCVLGLVDSLHVFKSISPKRESYKQEDLARSLLSKVYNAHNALCDVDCLSELVIYALKQDDKCITVKSFSPSDVKYNMDSNKEKHKNLPSLSILIASGVMKSSTADNVASSGLNFKHLQTIFQRKGEDGLYNVFTMKNSEGLPRVTNSKRVLESVIPKLVSYFDGK